MTHDELLLLIDTNSGGYLSKGNFVPLDEEVLGFVYALRAVVELHKPSYGDCEYCHTGQYYSGVLELEPYPCPTIQAIEKELK